MILLPRDHRLSTVKALKQLQISTPPRDTTCRQAASKSICQRRPQTRADRVMHSNASLSLLRASELRRSGMGCAAQCCVNGHQRHHTVQLQIDGELLAIMRRRSKKQEHPTRSLLAASRLPPATQLSVRGELIDATAARRCPTWT